MIRAIVFDLGGVLIDLDYDSCVRSFREILGYERITELLDLYHQKGIYGDMEGGLVTADEFRAEILKESRPGCVPADVDRAMAGLLIGMDPRKVPLLEKLAEKYPVYGLSNNNEISVIRMHEIYEENGGFYTYAEFYALCKDVFEGVKLRPIAENGTNVWALGVQYEDKENIFFVVVSQDPEHAYLYIYYSRY